MTMEVQKESYDFVSMLEISENDLIIQDTDKFNWDLVPVTDDWGSKIVKGNLRISQWMSDRVDMAEYMKGRLNRNTITVDDLTKNPGWIRCWAAYYRLEYNHAIEALCYVNPSRKEKVEFE